MRGHNADGSIKMTRLIFLHKRNHTFPNPNGSKPQFLYDEDLSAFYCPSADQVWLRLPEYLITRLGLQRCVDGHAYVEGSSYRACAEAIVKLKEKVTALDVPLIRKKIIVWDIEESKLNFWWAKRVLVEHVKDTGSFYHIEDFDGNIKDDGWRVKSGWETPSNYIPYTPEAEEWFRKAAEQVENLRKFINTLLYVPMENGDKRCINKADIEMMIATGSSPLPMQVFPLLTEGKQGDEEE